MSIELQRFDYTIENEKVCIKACYVGGTSVEIPEMIEGYPVTELAPYTFSASQIADGRIGGNRLEEVVLPKDWTEIFIALGSITHKTFSNFLTGQCVEAVILGAMFFIVMSIFSFPYAMLISVLIAFTALIPVFGSFVGCGVGVLLIFMVNPMKSLIFIVVFLVLQQIEGNFIYPHVVGNSVGLPSMWVLAAVSVGGSLFGVIGMLIFIPIVSVIYTLLRGIVNRRLKEKKINVI